MALVLVMTIMGVSATDIEDDQNLTDDNAEIVLSSDSSDEILSDGELSFSQLELSISKANEGSSIDLTRDYKYSDGDLISGIEISKKITINGNGHSIDGAGVARIFNITGDGVILNNIIIKNAFINNTLHYINTTNKNIDINIGNGAGILWIGANGVLNNSKIINNNIYDDVTFYNTADSHVNYTIGNGAGIYWTGNNAKIENTIIENNTITYNIIYQYNYRYYPNSDVIRIVANGAGIYLSGNNSSIRKS